ncbi:class A beta-lactamase [Luteibacter jiangsuensis]|uniref:Beta-lactamase n=1 Tax=Luteibacter jiangsuensis TaxID=637577 RepID=A0ABX0Q671_9GAMM|nr:class A beta-lactamase [Luteibacter jiangsuensis]NID05127.1 class A beta-lactamase [Luteibacter jiangsuensis]
MHTSMLRLLRASSALCFAVAMSMPAWASGTDAHLRDTLAQLAERAKPGTLGVTVVDMETHERTRINADRGYPMMSVFKAPVAAAVLAEVDAGKIALDQEVTIGRKDVVGGSAVPSIGAHFAGGQMRFTVERLLVAAVSESDNTAVDALIRLLGGPAVVTRYLRDHGIDGMRVDLSEGDVSHIFDDTANGQTIPENETEAALAVRRQRGYQAFMVDVRNTTTPDAAADFLEKLWRGKLLSAASTQRLLRLMYDQTVPNRLRAGLPPGVRFADKCGTSYTLDGQTAAFNDIGIVTWPDGHTVIVAAFLTGSRADAKTRNALFADIARAIGSGNDRK